jgi:hypothetical protein
MAKEILQYYCTVVHRCFDAQTNWIGFPQDCTKNEEIREGLSRFVRKIACVKSNGTLKGARVESSRRGCM